MECGKVCRSKLPEGVETGNQFDAATKAWISLLKFDCRASELTIRRLFASVGLDISAGQTDAILLENGRKLAAGYDHLRNAGIGMGLYNHTDSTGWKRRFKKSGKVVNEYLQFVGHDLLSVFAITRKYNVGTVSRLLGRGGRRKPVVSDDHTVYGDKLKVAGKQLCWIHEIRHFEKLEPQLKRHRNEVRTVMRKLCEFYGQAKAYGKDPTPEQKEKVEKLFDRLLKQSSNFPPLKNQLKLMKKKKSRLLLFLEFPYLPIHNNAAEQAVRHPVLLRASSRETKSEAGDRSAERHLSVIGTARKQGLNVFETLDGLLKGTLDPSVLTLKTLEV